MSEPVRAPGAGAGPANRDPSRGRQSGSVVGLVLAAGEGRRMGGPKALLAGADGVTFLSRAVASLREGGCPSVIVTLGARADAASALLPPDVDVVQVTDWAQGVGPSLAAGLRAAQETGAECVVVTLVDLPDVGPEVTLRLLGRVDCGATTLARASYAGRPGHPVLLGRDHWQAVSRSATGDSGAREYLRDHRATLVECGDLASGRDVDTPAELRAGQGPVSGA